MTANVTVLRNMLPISEPLRVKRVRVRALNSKFLINGRQSEPGDECILDHVDASILVAAGKAEIIGDAEPTFIPVADLGPPPGSGWMRK